MYIHVTSLSTDPLCVYLTTLQVTKFPRPFLFIFAYCKWQAVKALERSYGQHTHDFEVKSGQRLEIKPSLYKMCHNNLIYRTCHKRNDVLYTCRPPVRSMPVHVEHVAALLVCADASLCLVCTTAWTWRMYPLWLERWATRIHYWLGVYHILSLPQFWLMERNVWWILLHDLLHVEWCMCSSVQLQVLFFYCVALG